jgi:mannose-6-phosphate isomerase-like protein (cupin superfamily)
MLGDLTMTFRDQNSKPIVIHAEDCELEEWDDDIRGKVQWRTLISGDRTTTNALTCGVAEIPVGESKVVSLHQHAPAELYYILEGVGLLNIDGSQREVRAGSTAFIPGNTPHGLVNSGTLPLRLLYVFPVDSFSEMEYVFPNDPN